MPCAYITEDMVLLKHPSVLCTMTATRAKGHAGRPGRGCPFLPYCFACRACSSMHCGLVLHNSFGKLCKWSHCVHFGSSFFHLACKICLCRRRWEHIQHIRSQGSTAAKQSEPCKRPQLEKRLGRKQRQSKKGGSEGKSEAKRS